MKSYLLKMPQKKNKFKIMIPKRIFISKGSLVCSQVKHDSHSRKYESLESVEIGTMPIHES